MTLPHTRMGRHQSGSRDHFIIDFTDQTQVILVGIA